jgi:hypothetical protein
VNPAVRPHRTPVLLFLGFIAFVYTVAWLVVGRLPAMESASVVAAALTCDLVILVPFVYYMMFVRRGGHSILRVVPVVVISVVMASLVLPSSHQDALHFLEKIVAPIEIGLLGWVFWRAFKALRSVRDLAGFDPVEQFHQAAFDLLGNQRAAGVFTTEISVFYFALGSWRAEPHRLPGTSAFTQHQRSGQAGVVLGLVLLLVFEGLAVHLLLSMWSVLAAWIFTMSSAYGALWLIADYRATVLRPVLVGDERVLIRCGLRHTLEFSRSNISGIYRKPPEMGKEALSLKLLGEPSLWIVFAEAVDVQGAYGISRSVRAVGLDPDDPLVFEKKLCQ